MTKQEEKQIIEKRKKEWKLAYQNFKVLLESQRKAEAKRFEEHQRRLDKFLKEIEEKNK